MPSNGSHQTYGGWETRVCRDCGVKLTLKAAAGHYKPADRPAYSLCAPCIGALVGRAA